jgi:hypothetical protein
LGAIETPKEVIDIRVTLIAFEDELDNPEEIIETILFGSNRNSLGAIETPLLFADWHDLFVSREFYRSSSISHWSTSS